MMRPRHRGRKHAGKGSIFQGYCACGNIVCCPQPVDNANINNLCDGGKPLPCLNRSRTAYHTTPRQCHRCTSSLALAGARGSAEAAIPLVINNHALLRITFTCCGIQGLDPERHCSIPTPYRWRSTAITTLHRAVAKGPALQLLKREAQHYCRGILFSPIRYSGKLTGVHRTKSSPEKC